ncbi:MAG: hypothetical protein CYG61_05260 [Actinobacteria bacterium]|nr:MAG: hypothetical protein CYG61_05260 [Actinomycetota bacterium]
MPTEIDRHDVLRLLAGGAQLVEVLPAEEFEEEHLAGAVGIPLRELAQKAPAELHRDRPVTVYCYDSA